MDIKKTPQGRFNSLAGERQNPFGSSRQRRNSNSDDNSSSGGSTNGRYVPPSKRNANKRNNGRRGNNRSEGILLPNVEDRRKAPTPPPDTGNQELFPSLGSVVKAVDKPDDETAKPSFAAIATDKEESPKVPVEKEPLKPGWVRLFRGPNGEIMREHGPPVPENPYIKRLKEYEQHLARQHLIDTLERNIAYTREMDPYYDGYDHEQDDYDEEDDEEYMSDHEYVEEYESGDGEDY